MVGVGVKIHIAESKILMRFDTAACFDTCCMWKHKNISQFCSQEKKKGREKYHLAEHYRSYFSDKFSVGLHMFLPERGTSFLKAGLTGCCKVLLQHSPLHSCQKSSFA